MGRRRDAEPIEHGGHHVDGPDLLVHDRARAFAPRQAHDPRDVQDGVVQEDAVVFLAVLAEALAVIADGDDHRAVEPALASSAATRRPTAGRPPQSRRRTGGRGTGRERRRRRIGRVGVVEVDPGEEGWPAGCAPSHAMPLDDRRCRRVDLELVAWREVVERAVERVEALAEAVRAVENEGADEGAGLVAGARERLGQRDRVGRKRRGALSRTPWWGG